MKNRWYPIGMLNQASTDLGEFNGWQSGSIETVSAPDTWIVCKVRIADTLVTLEAWCDEHVEETQSSTGEAGKGEGLSKKWVAHVRPRPR